MIIGETLSPNRGDYLPEFSVLNKLTTLAAETAKLFDHFQAYQRLLNENWQLLFKLDRTVTSHQLAKWYPKEDWTGKKELDVRREALRRWRANSLEEINPDDLGDISIDVQKFIEWVKKNGLEAEYTSSGELECARDEEEVISAYLERKDYPPTD